MRRHLLDYLEISGQLLSSFQLLGQGSPEPELGQMNFAHNTLQNNLSGLQLFTNFTTLTSP